MKFCHHVLEVIQVCSLCLEELEDCQRILGAERDYEALKVQKHHQTNGHVQRKYIDVHVHVLICSQRQELESDNKKLKKDLQELRQSLSKGKGSKVASPGGQAYNVVLEQLNSTNEELEVRKEEVLILRSQLVNQEAFKHKVGAKPFSFRHLTIFDNKT